MKLRIEHSENCSGELLNEKMISELKEKHYFIKDYKLDGDAPKQFIQAYFYEEDSGVKKKKPKSWFKYIAKSAEKWYPLESVIEFMINRIGQEMGLVMNEIKLVRANGQIRFLSKYFLNKNDRLIHGAEICGEYLGDMDMAKEIAKNKSTARDLFTFEFIQSAIKFVFPSCYNAILLNLVKMIGFDALVGANDRHFYNWGVIDTKMKTKRNPKFAPIYDTARGLLWNFNNDNIAKSYYLHKQGGKKIINYIEDACPRISIEKNNRVNHFELIKFVKESKKEYQDTVNQLASVENEKKVLAMLRKEFYPFFIHERCALINLIIQTRFKKIRET